MDLVCVALVYLASTFISHPALPAFAPFVLWPVYWVTQGAFLTGLWVLAHECGHRAFSPSTIVCDIVGHVLHSALLVPYHPWRISHAKHHRSTNDMDRDEVFIPPTRSEMGVDQLVPFEGLASVFVRVFAIFKMLVFGWPAHLFMHATGRKYGKPTSHFAPSSPLFSPNEYHLVVVSDAVLLVWVCVLAYVVKVFGFTWLLTVFIIPYLNVNLWLVLITDLQHTDPKIPHYRGDQWKWIKGALCTVDRDYGILNTVFHHIGDTHVLHHIFHHIPHYHAQEASEAIKPLLGNYYLLDDVSPGLRGIAEALWKTTTHCRFVEDTGSVVWFKDH